MAGGRRVLVDTSAYFGLTNSRDNTHSVARKIALRLVADNRHLFTTNFILAETHALLLSRLGRTIAATVLADLDRSSGTIVRISVADEQRAREIIRQYHDKDFSLTDATSFAVMERLHIADAFAFDQHFAQFGFTMIGPDSGDSYP